MLNPKEDINPIPFIVQKNTGKQREERMWKPEDP